MEFKDIDPDLGNYINGSALLQVIEEIRRHAQEAKLGELQPLVDHVLNDRKFWLWPATKKGKHHNFLGGLALHELEVIRFAKAAYAGVMDPELSDTFTRPFTPASWRRPIGWRWLFVGCLFHDYGKVPEYHCTFERLRYQPDDPEDGYRLGLGQVESSLHGRMHFHVTDSVRLFRELSQSTLAPGFLITHREPLLAVEHMIHAHHGFAQWGSPVPPRTYEALVLHQADMLSVFHDQGTTPMER